MKSNSSRSLFFALVIFLVGSYSHGEMGLPSLKDNMSSMGTLVNGIAKGMNDVTTYSKSVASAEDIRKLLEVIVTQVPDSIEAMNKSKQASELLIFQGLITQVEGLDIQLAGALENGDKVMVTGVLNDMLALKKKGHDRFKL